MGVTLSRASLAGLPGPRFGYRCERTGSTSSKKSEVEDVSPNTQRRLFRNPGDQLPVPVSADIAASVRLCGENASAQLRQGSPAVRLALKQLDLVYVALHGAGRPG